MEVMIALFVLAIGLLGILAMQARSVQLNQNAYLYSQAAVLANDMMEAIRTTSTALGAYPIAYGESTPSAPACASSSADCNADAIADWNVNQWRTNIETFLPAGQGEIERVGDEFVVKIRFQIGFDENDEVLMDEVVLRTGV